MLRKNIAITLVCILAASATSESATAASATKLPDWNGIWENVGGIRFTLPVRDGKPQPPNPPPLNAEYQIKRDAVMAHLGSGKSIYDPPLYCIWPGMPRLMLAPFPFEIVFSEGRVTLISEYMSQVRRIRTDGSGHPKDLDQSYNGDSIGHWEGQTLVVDTVGLRDDTYFENTGLPHSDALRVEERIHLDGPDELVDEMTFTDAKVLTRPWKATWRYKRHRDWKIMDYVCEENNIGVNPNLPKPEDIPSRK